MRSCMIVARGVEATSGPANCPALGPRVPVQSVQSWSKFSEDARALTTFSQKTHATQIWGRFFFADGGPTVAGTNPAVVAVFARALTTFSQRKS